MVSERTANALMTRLAAEQSQQRLPSVVAGLVRDGELIWTGGRGKVADRTPDAGVQYRCGSITKTFVGVCVMRLRDEGRLGLSDTVDRFLSHTGIGELTIGQLDEVVRRELLEPLGMDRTTTRPQPPAAPGLAVHPWADLVLPEPEHDAGAMAPAGQLWTTVEDLARWAAFLSGHGPELLSTETLAEMREPRVIIDTRDEQWVAAYGLGLQVYNFDGGRAFGHGGSMPGFLAGLEIQEDGDALVEFCNATRGLNDLGEDLLKLLAEHEPRMPDEWVPQPSPDGTLELLGTWYWGPAPHVLVAHGDELEFTTPLGRGRASRFTAQGPDAWVGLDGYHTGEPLRVVRAADGAVSHLDLGSFVFTRVPYDPDGDVPGGVHPGGWRA
jgi:CubicO group peptidase (beta-lactamase class C family)